MVETHIGVGLNIVLLPSTMTSNAPFKFFQPPVDHLDRLPDHLLLLIFHYLTDDIKSLNRCAVLCRRFSSLISQIQHLTLHVPSHDVASSHSILICLITKRLQTLTQFLSLQTLTQFLSPLSPYPYSPSSLSKPLKPFKDIRFLKIQLPLPELRSQDLVLLKWKAKFGSSLNNLVVLFASSVNPPHNNMSRVICNCYNAAYTRHHYLLCPLISEHPNLTNVVLTDSDNQGELCMDKEQLDEFRAMSRVLASQRTLTMSKWSEPRLELPDGSELKEVALFAIRSSGIEEKREASEDIWVVDAFQEEPYHTVAEMLFKRRPIIL